MNTCINYFQDLNKVSCVNKYLFKFWITIVVCRWCRFCLYQPQWVVLVNGLFCCINSCMIYGRLDADRSIIVTGPARPDVKWRLTECCVSVWLSLDMRDVFLIRRYRPRFIYATSKNASVHTTYPNQPIPIPPTRHELGCGFYVTRKKN